VSGWIKVHRDIEDHWIFKDSEVFKRWLRLLMMANFEDSKVLVGGNIVVIKKGQMILSQQNISEKWNISRQTLRTFLNHLEKDEMISRDFAQKSNHKITILTICNYSKYQDTSTTNQPLINHRATTEQPQSNQIKEDKELKEGKETYISANADTCKPKKTKSEFNGIDCKNIFEHWKSVMGHPQSQMLDKRKRLIQKILDSGYTPIQAKLAIDGHKKSKWHKENGFDGIEYTLKPENIDKFIKMAGMTDAELNRTTGNLNWDDTSWADGLQAEYGVRN
jgi:hypothetical protein